MGHAHTVIPCEVLVEYHNNNIQTLCIVCLLECVTQHEYQQPVRYGTTRDSTIMFVPVEIVRYSYHKTMMMM